MRNTFTLILLLCSSVLLAQSTLYGVSAHNGGNIFQFNTATKKLATVYQHQVNEVFPMGTLSHGPDGRFYGFTSKGGFEKTGALFAYDAAASSYSVLYRFTQENGSQPAGSLVWGRDGKAYGLTVYGGVNNEGVLFSYTPATKTFTKLYEFGGDAGANPVGTLYMGANGLLYGVTQLGGATGSGVLFSFNPATSAYRKLHDFDAYSGGYPYGGLTRGKDGKLYGTTTSGGPEEWFSGSIYRFDPASNKLQHRYFFNWEQQEGAGPVGELTLHADGKLYGVTESGGAEGYGTLYAYDPTRNHCARLMDFSAATSRTPSGGLLAGSGSLLYGMLKGNTPEDHGAVFSYDPAKKAFKQLHQFHYADGANPAGGLSVGKDGRLFGLTPYGGEHEYGVLFALQPATGAFQQLKQFDEAPQGAEPLGGMVMHSDGWYYGSTIGGGHYGQGVIYRFHPASGQYQVRYRFGAGDGRYMSGSFVRHSNGRFYGLLNQGGKEGGVLFSFDPASGTIKQHHQFVAASGVYPDGSLLAGDDGKYYGVTLSGGALDYGVLFSFDPATEAYASLYDFDQTKGQMPTDGLTRGADGRLYGTTQFGGVANKGTLFVFDPKLKQLSSLYSFSGTDGERPRYGMTLTQSGLLVGTTTMGGASGKGVVFSFDPAKKAFRLYHQFSGADGMEPTGKLCLSPDGLLYGTTSQGGSKKLGSTFALNLASGHFSGLADFNGSNGGRPIGSGMTAYCSQMQTYYRDADGDGYGNAHISEIACAAAPGFTAAGNDCNDLVKTSNPGGQEICGNGIDDNCNGRVDEDCVTTPSVVIGNVEVLESQQLARVTISLTKAVKQTVKVHFTSRNGTAKEGADFYHRSGMVKIPAGARSVTIVVGIIADKVKEPNEYFDLVLRKAKGIEIKQGVGRITIRDVDRPQAAPSASVAAYAKVPEMNNAGTFQVLAFPNPSLNQFSLQASGNTEEKMDLVVVDGAGRVVEVRRGLAASQLVQVGSDYPAGVYLVRLVQGSQSATLKLLKR